MHDRTDTVRPRRTAAQEKVLADYRGARRCKMLPLDAARETRDFVCRIIAALAVDDRLPSRQLRDEFRAASTLLAQINARETSPRVDLRSIGRPAVAA